MKSVRCRECGKPIRHHRKLDGGDARYYRLRKIVKQKNRRG